ncbi:MAG: hypothetical protein ACLFVW_09280 [Phycisphaerae bacterium]
MNLSTAARWVVPTAMLAAILLSPGCDGTPSPSEVQPADGEPVPYPVSLLLPKDIRIHPFTGTRTFDEAGGVKGVEVRVEAIDHYGDSSKAFGDFRFELYTYRPNNPDPKDRRIAVWKVPLSDAEQNIVHWDNITRTYKFKLHWDQAIPVGRRFVLVTVFNSPFTERLFAERVFVSGQ